MTRRPYARALLVVLLVASGVSPAARFGQPVSPTSVVLEATLSLTDSDLAYGGTNRRVPGSERDGHVFGWLDGSIRLVGTIDTAGGCATPRSITATLEERVVRVELRVRAGDEADSMLACPAIFTRQVFYARISGLTPGFYDLRILAARKVDLPVPRYGVGVPAPHEP